MKSLGKTVWLVNFHAKPPHLEGYLKTIKFAQYLNDAGYDTYIIASNNFHNRDEKPIDDKSSCSYFCKVYNKLNFIHLKTIAYGNSSVLRIFSLIQFSLKLFLLKKRFEKPEIIIHTAYIPFDNLVFFTANALKAKYYVDILDLWPESFVDVGLIRKGNPILSLAYSLEKWLYKKANGIIFCIEGGSNYIKDKKWDRDNNGPISIENVHWISNGIDLYDFDSYKESYKIVDSDLEDDDFVKVIYLGSIRLANSLKELIDAAWKLQHNKKVKFLIYGDGNDRSYLVDFCKKNKITNVIFKQKWIDPKYVPYVLSRSSINVLNYNKGLGKYGGSQSKLFQYLASGKPICSNIAMKYCIIKKHNLGISETFASSHSYAEAIERLSNLDHDEKDRIYRVSRELVKEYDYKYLTSKLISIIEHTQHP